MSYIEDVVLDNLGWIILFLTIMLFLLGWWAYSVENAAYKHFMEACTKEHKDYECTVMWRAGRSNTTYIPFVFPTGKR